MTLLKRGPQGAMQTVLEVQLALEFDHMGEQVAEKGRVLVQQRREVERAFCGDELVEPDLVRRQLSPVAHPEPVVRIGA